MMKTWKLIKIKKSIPFIDSNIDEDNFINNSSININDDKENDSDDNGEIISSDKQRILHKYSFIQFFLINCYCKRCNKCKKSKQQEMLNLCNTLTMKYLSVDSILYNQMKFENFIKDYKWKNNSLNNIENNELFLKLKNLI